ncbi:MAG: penicillin-binding transpeptidase domain-containing protein [Chloroflexota bacterium]
MPRMRFALLMLVMIAAVGCRPQRQAAVQVPTLAVLPSTFRLEDAERVARDFLTDWENSDLNAMYSNLSFASQEANPFDGFVALYEAAGSTMTLENVEIQPVTVVRQRDEVAIFNYNVVFHTRLLGDFSDENRNLTLVVDDRAQEWRVAWTPDDLFTNMASGASLRVSQTIPNRANIYDRNGDVLADQNGRVVRLQITPSQIPNYAQCLTTLATALDETVSDLQAEFEAHPDWLLDVGEIEAQTYLDSSDALTEFCNVSYREQQTRRYITGAVMSHILGYVGYPDEADVPAVEAAGFNQASILGRAGVELTWDETLRGVPGETLTLVDSGGTPIRELARAAAQPGQSVWLTIDSEFQRQVQQIVADHYTQAKDSWGQTSHGASVVVMNPNTGEIYALVSYPSYDDNAYLPYPSMGHDAAQALIAQYTTDSRNPELNRPTQGVYTLGSTMKTVTATAAADSGVYALNQSYVCTGVWNRDITRYDWYGPGHGRVTLSSALTQSCNPFFYETGYQLDLVDPEILPSYMKLVGFGGPTGLTDIAEQTGFIPDPEWKRTTFGVDWTFSDSVNIAIGQGEVQVTPLQTARWYAAIANGGSLPTPYLVQQYGLIGDTPNPAHEPELTPTGIKPEVLATIREGICAVTTSRVGTAEFVFRNSPLQTIGVCGKTGTAQTGSDTTPSNAWFASYAPRENPQVVVVAMVETSGEGSEVAAPIAREVLETYFGMR